MKTIKDIAKLAKVSAGTVDRVLYDRGGVSKKTTDRIQKIITESGFTPNLIARNLKLKKEYNIGILIPSHDELSPFWDLPNKGMRKAMEEISHFGVRVSINYFDQYDAKSFVNGLETIISSDSLDGIIIAPHFTKEAIGQKERLNRMGIPYLFVNVDLKGFQNISFVGQDSFKSGYLAAKLFNATQRKNSTILIVEVLEDIENYYGLDNRVNGFVDFFDKTQSSLTVEKLKIPKYGNEYSFQKALTKSLITNNQVKGIFLPSSSINFVAKYLDDFEIKMDAVMGYDITEENVKYVNKGIISFLICQEPFNQGYSSVKLMFNHLVNKIELNENYLSPILVIMKENIDYYVL